MMNRKRSHRAGKSNVNNSAAHRSPYTTRAQAEFRSGTWKRLLGAVVLAVAGLVAFMIFGPEEKDIKERFEYYGVPDEIRIMNEISIDDGHDNIEKLPKSLRVPPPPANLEIEEETPDPEGTEIMPEKNEADPNRIDVNTKNPLENSEVSENYQVEMSLPMQTNQDFFIVHLERPNYPLSASESERRTPVIVVQVGIFVDPQGNVAEAMILASGGSRIFDDAVLAAVRKWKFGWLVEPGAGRWLQFPFNFKSPYFTVDR